MDYKKKHKIKKVLFLIFGIFIPLYSYLLSQKGPGGDLILVTFSQIGSRYGGIEQLIIWGIMTSLYYFTFLSYLFDISGSHSFLLRIMLSVTCLSLLITVFLPFSPTMFPIASSTHNYLAYVTASSTVITMLLFIIELFYIDRHIFKYSLGLFLIVASVLLTVLITYGVSSLFQITLASLMLFFMYIELLLLERSKVIDIYENMKKNDHHHEDLEVF